MKKILVPCDFSSTARQAYTFALDIARKTKGKVFVLKVIDIPFMYESYSPEVPAYLNPRLWKQLEKDARKSFKKLQGTRPARNVTFHLVQGMVTMAILDFIKKEKIDQVVMGTSGATGLDEYLIGSNTEKIVRYSKVPVFTIRKAVKVSSVRNIVVPTTMNLDQKDYIKNLKELQAFFGAVLHLVVVNTPHNLKRTGNEQGELEDFVKHYGIKNYTLNIRQNISEEDGILNFAQEMRADMLAMATHQRRGLAHLFKGSVTESMVNHGSLPIWTFSIRK